LNNYSFLAISVLTYILLYKILWLKNFHNVFFWALSFQWLAVNVKVIYSVIINEDFVYLHEFTDNIIRAWLYGNITIICVALGIRLSIKKKKFVEFDTLFGSNLNLTKFADYYIYFSILTLTVLNPKLYPAALIQIVTQLIYIKYVLFFIGFCNIVKKKQYNSRLFYYLLFEFILSFTGFFSNFKDIFVIIFISLSYVYSKKINVRIILLGSLLVLVFFSVGVIWQVVKGDYRQFLNKGEKTQEVSRGAVESLNYLYDHVAEINDTKFLLGIDALVSRIEYIDYFSACLDYVPLHKSHENGKILLEAFKFGFMPRILFPDKEILDDSKFTAKYTGVQVAGVEQGTSICLGYAANSYIDFGNYFFFSPLILGFLIGLIYNQLIKNSKSLIMGLAITFPLYFSFFAFGYEFYKIIPPLLYYFFIAMLYLKYGNKVIKLNFNI